MASSKKIQVLQAGRAVAALAVVLHHSDLAAHDFGKEHAHVWLFHHGYLGVDFFFVLSGFIIYHATVGRGRSAAEYSWARFKRIYLPYLPIGVGMALLYSLLPSLSESSRSWSWLPTLTLLPVASPPALSVAWTLKHEILFYALFGCLYFSRLLRPGLLVWTATIVTATLVGTKHFIPVALINLEFLMGIAIAVAYQRARGHLALLALAPIPFVIWLMLGAQRDWSVLFGLSLALMILPVAQLEDRGQLKVPPVLIFLGTASYSIYLAHSIAISAAARLFRGHPYPIVAGGAAAAGLAAGLAYYFLVERPILQFGQSDGRHQHLPVESILPASDGAAPSST